MPHRWTIVCCSLLIVCCQYLRAENADVRSLLQRYPQNQELIAQLGTRYEIVYPAHVRQDWLPGLSTRTADGQMSHLPQTTFMLDTRQFKFHLDLQLNTNLLAPTLVQLLYLEDSHIMLDKLPENCYYQATLRNHPGAVAALHTCNGLSGLIYLENKIFFIHPLLHGNQTKSHPHLLYHHFPQEDFVCGNDDDDDDETCPQKDQDSDAEAKLSAAKKFIELAVVIDQSMLEMGSSPEEAIAAAVQILNCADLLLRPLNASLSVVHAEVWGQDRIRVGPDAEAGLRNFRAYAEDRLARTSADAAHLLTGFPLAGPATGLSSIDSICTSKAVALTRVKQLLEPHLSAFAVAHGIAHNLGMGHDRACCLCSEDEAGCMMQKISKSISKPVYSSCSESELGASLRKGHGACLFNMPVLRTSVCGNGIMEEGEQCDCGASEACAKADSCCDPMTCRFVKHAQCSPGPCCKKCKLLSSDHLCRPSRGECDLPDFCDGISGQCPTDLHKRNGQVCGEGYGYCYEGKCPVAGRQCRRTWGDEADSADAVCFERLNVLGTPNGNCGVDAANGRIAKCGVGDAPCGSLQCRGGNKEPLSEEKPLQFVINRINVDGTVHECKSKSNLLGDPNPGPWLVAEGTKCGFQKVCVNRSCVRIRSLTGSGGVGCQLDEARSPCSGHGACTNMDTCYCDEGWSGADCELVAPDAPEEKTLEENVKQGVKELKLNANLAVTVIAASVLVGVGLVAVVLVIFLLRRKMQKGGNSHRNYRFE